MSDALVPFQPDALQRRAVVRNLRMSARGVAFAALVAGVVVSGLLPMSASAGATLVTLDGSHNTSSEDSVAIYRDAMQTFADRVLPASAMQPAAQARRR